MRILLKECLSQLAHSGLKTRVKIKNVDKPESQYFWLDDLIEKKAIKLDEYEVIEVSQSDLDLVYYLKVSKRRITDGSK